MNNHLDQYAHLLVEYCLEIKAGQKLLIQSTTLGLPLVKKVFQYAFEKGAIIEYQLDFEGKDQIFRDHATKEQLQYIPELIQKGFSYFDAFLNIRAPFDLKTAVDLTPEKNKIRYAAMEPYWDQYFQRTGSGEMKRTLCQFPTPAAAEMAEMTLEAYEDFIHEACMLDQENPIEAWKKLGQKQQRIVDFLQTKNKFRYLNEHTDLTFTTKGRSWINSDGKANMPSGEVFTSPEEESVNGHIFFDYPLLYKGEEIQGISLEVENGWITAWKAQKGQNILDKIMQIDGARRFGEAAIGTNYNISRFTKNILFDEKIGGTVHLAIGQSYLQAGGKNKSPIHLDMIADMKTNGKIEADGELIYNNGTFLID